jgi:hypothetical protein
MIKEHFMRCYYRAIPFTLLLTVGPLISAAPTQAASGASPQAVTLKLSDMPSGFIQLYAKSLSLKAFAKDLGVNVSQATGKGFIDGYGTMFSKRATRGIVWVADQADAFRTSGGARWAYRVALPTTGKWRRVSTGRVGDQNSAYLLTLTSGDVSISTYVIVFRRGAYFALVSAGAVGKFKTSRLLHYAKVMDGRMQTVKKPSPTPTSTPTNTPLPTSTPTNTPTPTPTPSNASPPIPTGATGHFLQVSAGQGFTCGVKSDHNVACWGNNLGGQASPPSGSFLQVSAGWFHTCGVKNDGSVACWGNNDEGQSPFRLTRALARSSEQALMYWMDRQPSPSERYRWFSQHG